MRLAQFGFAPRPVFTGIEAGHGGLIPPTQRCVDKDQAQRPIHGSDLRAERGQNLRRFGRICAGLGLRQQGQRLGQRLATRSQPGPRLKQAGLQRDVDLTGFGQFAHQRQGQIGRQGSGWSAENPAGFRG